MKNKSIAMAMNNTSETAKKVQTDSYRNRFFEGIIENSVDDYGSEKTW